ncbi:MULTISPECIES: ABC transporter substrate-binding protein [Actinomycetaceae]|nr:MULTISPECIES: ABC transporter substrate-binding protein [Actinomycetaceae]EFU61249.1 ribose ABC superfamily ATP binding cassette transporter, binding protein [Actinomyces sp. oral taxon 180 str. F0310]UUO93546.1 ABC transporter substrate-binding protein [Schaalia odontolytica]
MRPIGRIVAAAAVGSMALGLAACTTSTDSTATKSGDSKTGQSSGATKVDTSGNQQDWEKAAVKGDGTKTVYLVSKGFQHRFWQAVKEGAEQAGDELGYKVNFVGPQDETKVTEQTDQLKSALDSGPAAIGFAALDSKAAADLLSEINSKGIPVVAFDSGVESDIPVTTVQTDNKAAAAEAAKHMIELLKGKKGSVGMVCHDSTSTTGKQRCEGFKEYFKANAPADLKLLDEQIAGEVTKAADTSLSIIQANSDIVGMYGSNEAAASGIVQGVAESGKDVTVVGFDSGKTQMDAIKSGTEAGAVTQSPVKIGYYTVKAAVAALNGAELPKVIDSGFAWYDKSNIDNAEIKANLYE